MTQTKIKYSLLWLLSVLLLGSQFQTVKAQKMRFDHFTVADGLSNGRVSYITQDSLGFIWIATLDGLNRFDGINFENFSHKPSDSTSLGSNAINGIFCEGQNIWISTNKGIDRYNINEDIFYHVPVTGYLGLNLTVAVTNIYKDLKGRILISSFKGISIYDATRKAFVPFHLPLPANIKSLGEVTFITQDRDSIYWIGTQDLGVFQYNERDNKLSEISYYADGRNALLDNKVFSIYEDNHHTIWIGTNVGLYTYSKSNGLVKRYMSDPNCKNCLPHITVNQIFEDSRNNLWLATNSGLSVFNRKEESFTNYFHDDFDHTSLNNNSIHFVFEDLQRNLWIGSGENGINILKSQTIEFDGFSRIPNKAISLNYSYVLSVAEDKDENIWIGTNGGGVNVFDSKTQRFRYFIPPFAVESGRKAASINTICETNDGKIWMGAYMGGIVVFDPRTNTNKTYVSDPGNPNSLSNNIVYHVFQDSKNNIWVATNGGLNIFRPKTNDFEHIKSGNSGLSSDGCTVIFEDKAGTIWIGSYLGLNSIDPKTRAIKSYMHQNSKNSISSDIIYSIYEDSKGNLWVGTDFGLDLFDRKTGSFTVYTVDNGLPNNMINGILEDSRGYLWISTNKGIARFDSELKRATNYNTEDGLLSAVYHHGAYFKNKKGRMYFGGTEGLTFFNPDKVKHSKYKVPLVFTGFYLFNEPMSPKKNSVLETSILNTKEVTLRYDQSFLAIGFASLNYVSPNKDSYLYYLEGFDRDWYYVGNQRIASYTNLPPGTYTFHVKSINENGVETHNSLLINVKPPFWRTIWAYILYTIVIGAILFLVYSYLHSKTVYKHNLLLERIEKEKAIEINQAKIRFFINVSHDFKTPLTLIISPLEKLISSGKLLTESETNYLYHLIYRNTLRLSRLINQIMDLRKIDTGNIRLYVTKNEIVGFVKEMAVNFEEHARNHSIDFKVETQLESLDVWFDIDKIEKVIFNLLSNAFRYTSDGKSIKVVIELFTPENLQLGINCPEGCLKVSIIDQGRGIAEEQQEKIFNRFYQVQSETLANPASSGVGLSIAKEFVEMHSGIIQLSSELKKGSCFSVIIPLGKSHFKPDELAHDGVLENTLISDEALKNIVGLEALSSENQEEEKHQYKLLVVEDNFELRKFLADNLRKKYAVYEAANGKEAIAIVLEHYPDLVISDVMMPKMNGIELCKTIKTDIKTSHIPVILLTVLNSINNQIDGFEIGADDYITKPFNINLLEARIFNIIETRKKLNRKFVEEIKPEPKTITHNTLDEKFIQKAIDVVDKNISNIEFSAEDFADQIGISRSNLHIKLKALTNQSATEFIRVIRLKKAIELLSINQYNISEVSYMVGFNSISYFNRCFKQQYGITPTEFLNDGLKK